MTPEHSLREMLHTATHRIPGVPAHVDHPAGHSAGHSGDHPAGHQGKALQSRQARTPRPSNAPHMSNAGRPGSGSGSWNHSPARPPRVFPAWQRRIARLFGQEM